MEDSIFPAGAHEEVFQINRDQFFHSQNLNELKIHQNNNTYDISDIHT